MSEEITKAQMEAELQARWYAKEWDKYKIEDSFVNDLTGETIPAKYLRL